MMTGEKLSAKDDWDEHWDRYAAAAALNPAQRMRHDAIVRILKTAPHPVQRLLDVGSGQGDFLSRAVAERIARVYAGFEMSESGISISKTKVPGAEFVRVDLFAPPADAARFAGWADAAVCSDVIEHVDDPVGFLRNLRTYLAPGALLALTVPGGPMSTFDHHIGHRRHYTKRLAREVLEDAGFMVDTVMRAGFPFFNLYRLVVIARGARLIEDVESDGERAAGGLARLVMALFRVLFRFNLKDSTAGWQIVAVARNA
jgi:cyclopropane fatty-acyl-phospholipid synthase-like methyltransferase